MRILLTGAGGQLGRALIDRLPTEWDIHPFTSGELDITHYPSVKHRFLNLRPDVVINAAAYTAVDKAESDPKRAMAVNAEGPTLLAEAANQTGARLIHVSTDYVFDGNKSTPWVEGDAPAPINVYGLSKFAGEVRLINTLPDALIVRSSWVFSEYGQNFVRTMLDIGLKRQKLSVIEDQIGNPTYAGDLADFLIFLAQKPQVKGVVHFAGDETISWFGFALAIFKAAAAICPAYASMQLTPISSEQWPSAAKRPRNSALCSLRQAELDFPSSDWRARLSEVVPLLLAANVLKKAN